MKKNSYQQSPCSVCLGKNFEEILQYKKLTIFSALHAKAFSEKERFDAVLLRCKACGFVRQPLTPVLERFLAGFYTKKQSFFSAPPAEDAPNARVAFNLDFVKKHRKKPFKHILEIGCYDGYFLEQLRKEFHASEAVGLEILKIRNRFPKIQMVHTPYPTQRLSGKKFDLVVALNVLEHVFDPEVFMYAIRENLADDGQLLIEVPNEERAFTFGMLTYQYQHISYFTPRTLKRFLLRIGFKVDALYTKDLDRLFLICSKTKPASLQRQATDTSSLGYAKRLEALVTRFKHIAKPGELVGLYGACNFTHYILQAAQLRYNVRIFDGDPRKEGAFMSTIKTPVQSWRAIDSSGVKRVFIMPLAFTPEIYRFLVSKKIKTPIQKLFERA